jgi:CelD/BcsL family acetyltransferase involved in cellulose biosynthesis
LRKVRSDAIAASLLTALGARITATDEAPFLDLKPFIDASAFDAHLATKGRNKNRRRQSRRLHDLGPVEFETHAGTEEAARLAVDAIALKRNWLEAKQQVSLALTDAKFSAFFADVAGGRSKPAPVEVRALRSNGRIAALQVLLVSGEARFLHIVVYADEFEKCGVGSLLLENTVKESYRAGNATFDLLPPKYEYKSEFSDASVLVHDHALALSLVGRAYIASYLGFRRRIKQTIEAAPGPVRHAIGRGLSAIQRLRA